MDIAQINLMDLAGGVDSYRKISATEYSGSCPACGGKDRFHIQPKGKKSDGRGAWTCHNCYLDRLGNPMWGDALDYVKHIKGMEHWAAVSWLGLTMAGQPKEDDGAVAAPDASVAPTMEWQEHYTDLHLSWIENFWSATFQKPRAWLYGRGFTDETLSYAAVGLNTETIFDETWGWIPRGVVIPWMFDEVLWKLSIRRPDVDCTDDRGKYITLRGSSNLPYGVGLLSRSRSYPPTPAQVVEGPLDVWAIRQTCGDLIVPVGTGTTQGRHLKWAMMLSYAPVVLNSLDNDANEAGERGGAYWQEVLGSRCVRWSPLLNDPAKMLEMGMDIPAWVQQGLDHAGYRYGM